MKNVKKIKPTGLFTNYIFKAIPLAFDESLSYYETLCGLLSYLENTVLPTVNNNADAVIEVQKLMTELQNYVANYFNNLDVQDEINKKLDEMVKDGTLQSILMNYASVQKIYNTHQEMIEDTGLVNDMKVKTLGYYTINDGGGAEYYITNNLSNNYQETTNVSGLYAQLLIKNDLINVLQIGLKNNDENFDNFDKFNTFINNYKLNHLHLYFPYGYYNFNKHNIRNNLPEITKITGNNSNIFFNDDENIVGVSLFSGAIKHFEIQNINFKSTFDKYGQNPNTAQLYYEEFDTESPKEQIIIINNCNFEYFRKTLMSSSRSKNVTITNCTYKYISRDCNRFLGAEKSFVSNCKFYQCGDDVISCHGDVPNSQHTFCNNYLYASYGVGILGGKFIDIYDNEFILPFNLFKCGYDGNEGGITDTLNFHNNKIIQPAHTSYTGRILGFVNQLTNNIFFNNNEIIDGNYTKINLVTIGEKYNDVPLDKGMFTIYINSGNLKKLEFNNNYSNYPFGPSKLGFGDTQLFRGNIDNLIMKNNTIENFYSVLSTTPKLNWIVESNYFNGDTQHLLTTDGKFETSNILRIFSLYPVKFTNNILRNISGNFSINHKNSFLYQPDNKYFNPIQDVSPCVGIPYSELENNILNDILEYSSSMPTSGYYRKGMFVKNIYTIASNPIGWYRLTTGNTHTLNVDWQPIYAKTSTN